MANSDILISYIIPAYNAEKYIKRCVESIVCADNKTSCEVIIIENGSTDKTAEVCEGLANEHSSVKLYHSDKGVSNARNAGIEKAVGKWLFFVDADDYLISDKYDVIGKCANSDKYDLYIFGHRAGDRVVYKSEKELTVYGTGKVDDFIIKALKNPTIYLTVWGKLFARDIIIKNNLWFDLELKFAEDSHFTLQYLKCINSLCLCRNVVYEYSVDSPSVMRGNASSKFEGYIKSLSKTKNIFENENVALVHTFSFYVIMHLNIVMVRTVFSVYNRAPLADKMRDLRRLCKVEIIESALKDVKILECLKISMLPCLFIKIKCYLLAALVFRARAVQNYRREN